MTKPVRIVVQGNIAYDWGSYEGRAEAMDGTVRQFSGKYLIVWRKGVNGDWLMVQDMWN
ncbi:MAG: hypothetical protein AAFN70_13020 [Planctomycetota bacterium]